MVAISEAITNALRAYEAGKLVETKQIWHGSLATADGTF